jgi:hypothetical protein
VAVAATAAVWRKRRRESFGMREKFIVGDGSLAERFDLYR